MQDETSTRNEPIGLYRHPDSGAYIGALETAAANAYYHHGFRLVEEGADAARMTDDEIEARFNTTPQHNTEPATAGAGASSSKKGSK